MIAFSEESAFLMIPSVLMHFSNFAFVFVFLPLTKYVVSERRSQLCFLRLFDRDETTGEDDPCGK
jgi:hypothetical protein